MRIVGSNDLEDGKFEYGCLVGDWEGNGEGKPLPGPSVAGMDDGEFEGRIEGIADRNALGEMVGWEETADEGLVELESLGRVDGI